LDPAGDRTPATGTGLVPAPATVAAGCVEAAPKLKVGVCSEPIPAVLVFNIPDDRGDFASATGALVAGTLDPKLNSDEGWLVETTGFTEPGAGSSFLLESSRITVVEL
jgi:hypothetical protein